MKKLLFIAFIGLVLISCNKNQKVVKVLDGKWIATSFIVTDGQNSEDWLTILGIKYQMEFENCKLKKDETCDMTITVTDSDGLSGVEGGNYKVIDDGNKIEYIGPNNQTEIYSIDELTDNLLVIKFSDFDLAITVTLSKQ